MKKSLLLSIMIAGSLGLVFSPNSLALYQEENISWWSAEELLTFSEEVDAETEALCGADYGCRENLYFSRLENDNDKHWALYQLQEGRFWMTSINPATDELEVLYLDEDPMLSLWGIEEKEPLDFIFLAWFERENGQIGNYNYEFPAEEQFSDDLHQLFVSDALSFNGESVFPSNTPFTLPIYDTNLEDNQLARVYLAIFGERFNSKGYIDYSSCVSHPDYFVGDTCTLLFSDRGEYQFFPSSVIKNTTTGDDEGANIATPQTDPEGLSTSENPTTLEDTTTTEEIVNSTESLKAPHTGTLTGKCEKVVEFPWWLGALLVIGNIVILWFFGQKSQKNP